MTPPHRNDRARTQRAPLRALLGLLSIMSATLLAQRPREGRGEEERLRIAVVELRNAADLKEREVMALTARVRASVAERLGGRYLVMTRENILAMVDEQT